MAMLPAGPLSHFCYKLWRKSSLPILKAPPYSLSLWTDIVPMLSLGYFEVSGLISG